MKICLCITRMFLFIFFVFIPTFLFSTAQLSHPTHHHHLGNASDQEALLRFLSGITHDPSQSLLTTWKPNVSFCNWTAVICSRRRQRVVSLNVSSMGLEGTISPHLGNLSFLRILSLRNNSFHGHIPYQLGTLFRLKMLRLSLNQLQGSIPPTLAGCRNLRNLSLSYNTLTGNIPSELCVLPKLQFFNLCLNNLTGTIPACLGNISSLEQLWLSYNSLTGNIPSELCVLPKLQFFNLGANNLTGTIPACLGNISSLEYIYLGSNQLHGSVPYELGMLSHVSFIALHQNHLTGQIPAELCSKNTQLLELYLLFNQLSGSIPASLSNCTNLHLLSLSYNQLTGHIPAELCSKNTQLLELYLIDNQLSGSIPASLSNCTNLHVLSLSYNQLTGHIPAELCSKNTQLLELYLLFNQLSGSIPASLFNCTNLQLLVLSKNQISGVLPMEVGKLTQLHRLYLNNNQLVSGVVPILTVLINCSALKDIYLYSNHLTGRLPSSIGHLSTNMHQLSLGRNGFSGEIPPQIGNLTNLTYLDLSANFFTGSIPSPLNTLQKLERLYMVDNNLQGNIPMEIGYLKSLGLLSLGTNHLSGRIPDSLGCLQQLRYLYLCENQLSGNIPANLGKSVNLLELDLSYNKLSGDIPREVGGLANLALYFNLSNNLLHGPIPLELSKLTMIQVIDISANQLSGYIPSGLGSCKELEYLNLSCNALEGPIPMSLGELLSLQDVDFSSNNLSGGIPMSLVNLKMLNQLNLSFNNLSGKVPEGGVFKKLGAKAFIGNPNLCGPWVSLPPCYTHKNKSVLHLKKVIVPILAVVVIVVSCLFFGILWRWNCKRHIPIEAMASLNLGHQRISYGELIIATEEFSDANLLGVGSFGKVYKGVLNDGTIVAVKLLNLENEGAHKSFDKECKVLGRVRHRNLIRIITSYSNPQIKALIFPLMPNGSLGKWLYPDDEVKSGLTLIQRLNIAIDIAHGMAYLHHHCFMQVIHCDLKPNNVLLGEDMTAYLIDFGIATICFANSEDLALTSTHALKGSTGYIPPEYGLGGRVTTKGDVYSYGVVLLEMITRKKPTDNMFVEGMNLQKWVGSSFPNRVGEVVDKSILRRINTIAEEDKELNCLNHLVSMGLLCTKESPKERPTMINIVSTLQNIKETFLGAAGIPEFQSDITHFLDRTSIVHNNTDQGQSSSTF